MSFFFLLILLLFKSVFDFFSFKYAFFLKYANFLFSRTFFCYFFHKISHFSSLCELFLSHVNFSSHMGTFPYYI